VGGCSSESSSRANLRYDFSDAIHDHVNNPISNAIVTSIHRKRKTGVPLETREAVKLEKIDVSCAKSYAVVPNRAISHHRQDQISTHLRWKK
jgi:hypothetical protein